EQRAGVEGVVADVGDSTLSFGGGLEGIGVEMFSAGVALLLHGNTITGASSPATVPRSSFGVRLMNSGIDCLIPVGGAPCHDPPVVARSIIERNTIAAGRASNLSVGIAVSAQIAMPQLLVRDNLVISGIVTAGSSADDGGFGIDMARSTCSSTPAYCSM